ncbi:MAG: hypothetical protein RL246_4 [Bacteroidota bacterium]
MRNPNSPLIARCFDSGFPDAHDTYNAMSMASDGRLYYVLSSDKLDVGGQMFRFNPSSEEIKHLGDLNVICGQSDKKCIAQGKSHVLFYEYQQKLYFATHVGYYQLIDGMDRLPEQAPDGFDLYPGGHILSYDLGNETFEDLSMIPDGEGVVSMCMDTQRGNMFGITWPTGQFFTYQVKDKKLTLLGKISGNGEAGTPGEDFRSLCRSLVVDEDTGHCYWTTIEGDIFYVDPMELKIHRLSNAHLRLDYFGKYEPSLPGTMGYHWRQIFWYAPEQVAYGVHGNSGYLFKFDPKAQTVEIVDRITSLPSKKSGFFDQFSYGYLGFTLGPDGKTIYYLTGGPIFENGKRIEGEKSIAKGAAKGLENLHLITYEIPTNTYHDHGPIFYENGERPLYVNSISVDAAKNVYTLARVNRNGKIITDLIKINLFP